MITYIKNGSLFDKVHEAYVNPVNCVGVMGGGLALEFKNRFPEMYKAYAKFCYRKLLKPGGLYTCAINVDGDPQFVINLATKDNYRDPSQLKWVDEGLQQLAITISFGDFDTIAIPALGCGLGGLDWNDVKPLMEKHLLDLKTICYVYLPK